MCCTVSVMHALCIFKHLCYQIDTNRGSTIITQMHVGKLLIVVFTSNNNVKLHVNQYCYNYRDHAMRDYDVARCLSIRVSVRP